MHKTLLYSPLVKLNEFMAKPIEISMLNALEPELPCIDCGFLSYEQLTLDKDLSPSDLERPKKKTKVKSPLKCRLPQEECPSQVLKLFLFVH